MKPLLGSLLYRGICPPSNPGLTPPPDLAFWPFSPLPAFLPNPEPVPLPILLGAFLLPAAGFNS